MTSSLFILVSSQVYDSLLHAAYTNHANKICSYRDLNKLNTIDCTMYTLPYINNI